MSDHVTRLGLQVSNFNFLDTRPEELLDKLTEIAITAEESGFDSIWVMDHLNQIPGVGPPELWMLEGNVALGAIAARTRTIKLGLLVGGVTYRNPALHAKATTTLDVLSGGRAIHGIGAAWYEDEHNSYGFRFPPLKERFERLEDHLNIVRAMFTQTRPTYEGTHHSVREVLNNPQPIRGDIPIMIGGAGRTKTLRMVAQYADASNFVADVATAEELVGVIEGHCEAVGRDPAEITKTRLGTVIIGDTHEAAHATADVVLAGRERAQATAMIGDPDEIAEQASAFFDVGLDGHIVGLPDPSNLEALAAVGRSLSALR